MWVKFLSDVPGPVTYILSRFLGNIQQRDGHELLSGPCRKRFDIP